MVQLAERPLAAPQPADVAPLPALAWPAFLPYAVLALVGLFLRMHEVGQRALHHDESLHAVYSWYLYVGRGYIHDPLMHGPYQFHVPAFLYFLFGDSNVTARLAAVLHGTGCIVLPYFLRDELGKRGALVAAILLTISPSYLYFSRFMREDMLLAFMTFGMVVGIFGWIRTRKPAYLYFGSFSLICAFATKEATYIHGFTFVTFFVWLWVASWKIWDRIIGFLLSLLPIKLAPAPARGEAAVDRNWQVVWRALLDIQPRTWVACFGIFLGLYTLLFTTFFTNLGNPWECLAGRPCSKGGLYSGSIGALVYWIEQHDVQRGGQPYYYYVLLTLLYEFLPLVFALAALTTAWFRTSLFGWFLAYWFLGNFIIYSWAGEKMPWLLPHMSMPLILLASRWLGDWSERVPLRKLLKRRSLLVAGLALGACTTLVAYLALSAAQTLSDVRLQSLVLERYTLIGSAVAAILAIGYLRFVRRMQVGPPLVAVALIVLGSFYVRTSWMVTYKHGDIPHEMLVYVQSSPDITWVSNEIDRIAYQTAQRQDLRILMDNGYVEQVNGQPVVHEAVSWPFEWYLRDYKNRQYYSKTFGPNMNLRDFPVILVMAPNLEPIRDQLGDYTGQKYRLNWWFPEDYKLWQNNPGAIWTSLSDPVSRARFLKFLLYREPMNILGSRDFYMFVRKDVQTLGPAATTAPAPSVPARAAPPVIPSGPRDAVAQQLDAATTLFGVSQGGEPLLLDPKGVAVGPDGKIYVTEGRAGRVTVFNPNGTIAAAWGRPGSAEGEMNEPWGIAVGQNGEVFVADTWNHRIQKFAPDGRLLTAWGGQVDTGRDIQGAPGRFWGPRSIAIGPDNLVYVSDTGNKRIQVFDPNGGFVRAFGGLGTEPGQLNEPVGLAFDGDTLIVADAWNGRLQRLDRMGAPLGEIPIQGWEGRNIANKPYVAVGPDRRIYVTLPELGQVFQVSPEGLVTPLARPGDRANRLGFPTGIAVGPNNELIAAEATGGTLTLSRLGGAP